jgi:hypothetical protein
MTDHLADGEAVAHIAKRAETYLHLARRVVRGQFCPEAAHDHVLTIATVASMMATLEHAEITASAQDRLARILEGGDA